MPEPHGTAATVRLFGSGHCAACGIAAELEQRWGTPVERYDDVVALVDSACESTLVLLDGADAGVRALEMLCTAGALGQRLPMVVVAGIDARLPPWLSHARTVVALARTDDLRWLASTVSDLCQGTGRLPRHDGQIALDYLALAALTGVSARLELRLDGLAEPLDIDLVDGAPVNAFCGERLGRKVLEELSMLTVAEAQVHERNRAPVASQQLEGWQDAVLAASEAAPLRPQGLDDEPAPLAG